MIILNCPMCSEAVTMASGLRPTSKVRCPLCLEEYVLADALGKLPPSLISLDEPATETSVERPLEPTWESSDGEGAETGDRAAPTFAFGSTAGSSTPATGAPRLVTRPRPKRKPKNPLIEVVKVVGGGIAGLLIAQLILWWFPVKAYRRDPFELGPKVANIGWLRFMVPQEYRPGSNGPEIPLGGAGGGVRGGGGMGAGLNGGFDGSPNSGGQPSVGGPSKGPVDWNAVIAPKKGAAKDDTSGQTSGKGIDRTQPDAGKAKPAAPSDDLILDDLTPSQPVPANNPLGGVRIDLDGPAVKPPAKKIPSPATPPEENVPDENAKPPANPTVANPAATGPEQLPSVDGKVRSVAAVQQEIKAARAAGDAWLNSGEADRIERRRLGEAYYLSLARVAATTTALASDDVDAAEVRESFGELGRATMAEQAFAGLVEFLGQQHLADATSAGRGIALVGRLKSNSDPTEQPHLLVEMKGKESQVVVVVVVVPSDSPLMLKAGDRVFILGVVAAEPDDHRDPGDTRPVVISSLDRVIVAPASPATPADPPADEPASAK